MKVLDPGHVYELAHLDGTGTSILTFVKREGDGYPGNVGHHEGTNLQEALRALIDRVKYLDGQIPSKRNATTLNSLRRALHELESRAADRHGRLYSFLQLMDRHKYDIETLPTCTKCGHIGCSGGCH